MCVAGDPPPAGEPPAGPPAPPLELFLLGRFEVVRGGAPVPAHAWRRHRPADLLQLLALARDRALGRDQVVAALWPGKDAASGANNLHRALYDLRQVLGGRWVDIERGQLTLDPSVWLDVDAFERAAATRTPEALAEAVALYRGDLLPGVREPWVSERRDQLRLLFVQVAVPVALRTARAGDAAAALPLLRRLVELEPLREETHRELMRLLAASGRRGEALRAYAACEAALRTVGRIPSEDTRALRQAIQAGAVGPSHGRAVLEGAPRASRRLLGTADPPPLRGRDPWLLQLEELVERGAGMLVILGERGVGKTRLALEGARLAQGQGAAVLAASAVARAGVPYGLFADLFRDGHEGGDLLATTPGAPAEQNRLAIQSAVLAALAGVAEGRPLFLLLDDLHEADESSLGLVHHLALHAAELRLMIVATCRDDELLDSTPIGAAIAQLDAADLARGVHLPRLSRAGTREQLADLLGAPPGEELVAQVYQATDGAPHLVEEAARAFQATGQVPADPAEALRARATALEPRSEALLSAAAVPGGRFELEVVRAPSGLSPHDALRTLEECLASRLVGEDGSGYSFRSELVREALEQALPAPRRGALHAAVADALEAAGADRPDLLALHRQRAGQVDRALRHLVTAGHRAEACSGLPEAHRLYLRAIELLPRAVASDALRRDLHEACGRVQLALGDGAGAVRSFGQVIRVARQQASAEETGPLARARRLTALALVACGGTREALAAVEEGVAAAGSSAEEERAALLHLAAQLHYHDGRIAETVAAGKACAEAAERAGDLDLMARGRDLVAMARALTGEPLPPVDDATRAADRLAQDLAPEHLFDPHLALWDRDLLGDRTCAEVGRAASVLAERARQRHAPDYVASGRHGEGVAALAADQLEAADAHLRAAREGFREVCSGMGEALALERLAALSARLGRFDDAARLLAEAATLAERGTLRHHVLTRIHAARVRLRLAAGLPGRAGDAAGEAAASAVRHGECVSCEATLRPELVRVALAFGRLDEADAEAQALEELARQQPGRGLQAVARLARARVLAAGGRPDDALVALAQARAGFLAGGHRHEAARTVRLEARLRGSLPEAWRELDALVTIDPDA